MDPKAIYDNLAFIPEVDSDTPRHIALDLPNAPIGLVGMAHQHTGGENGIQIIHNRNPF